MKKLTCFLFFFFLVFQYVSGQKEREDGECKINYEKDKFTGQVKIYTPITTKMGISPLIFYKMIGSEDTTFYLAIYTYSSIGDYGTTGVYIIFEDGERWIKEEAKIRVDYISSYNYSYVTQIRVHEGEIEKLKTKKITDVRLGRSAEKKIESKDAEKFICSLNRVLSSN